MQRNRSLSDAAAGELGRGTRGPPRWPRAAACPVSVPHPSPPARSARHPASTAGSRGLHAATRKTPTTTIQTYPVYLPAAADSDGGGETDYPAHGQVL